MNTNLKVVMFELRCLKPKSISIDEEKLSEMGRIADKVEELELDEFCKCHELKLYEEKFIRLFESLNWEPYEEHTYKRLLDRLHGKDRYILPEIIDLTEEPELS